MFKVSDNNLEIIKKNCESLVYYIKLKKDNIEQYKIDIKEVYTVEDQIYRLYELLHDIMQQNNIEL